MKLTLLGTGTPAPQMKKASSGYLVEIGKDVILLDHGPGAHQRLLETGLKAENVTHVLFTHLHYDHCLDYVRLVLQRWDIGRAGTPELKVFGPQPIRHMTEALFGPNGAFAADIEARTHAESSIDVFKLRGGTPPRPRPSPEVREVVPGDVIAGSTWKVTVGRAQHMEPYLDCWTYRLDSLEGSICYSGDSGGVCQDLVELATNADVLIHMCHYLDGTAPSSYYARFVGSHLDAARVAQAAKVKTLVLSHQLEFLERPGVKERTLHEVCRIFDGAVVWGEDLMVVPLKPHRPQVGA